MKAISTAVAGTNASAADYNTLQARARGQRPSSGGELGASVGLGTDTVIDQRAAGFANATPTKIDGNHDWRDRVIWARYCNLTAAANRPGGANDWTDWSTLGGISTAVAGYTGTGGLDAGGVNPTAGNPPVAAAGPPTSYLVTVLANVWLYVEASTGHLYLYNNTGAALHLWLEVEGSADLGLH